MNEKQAIAKLKKIVGRDLAYRIDPKAATAEDRQAACAKREALRLTRVAAVDALEARRTKILEGDAEYQRLKAELATARSAAEANASVSLSYRITVGRSSKLWFSVLAQGDNWDDVINKLEKETA
jgi:predicted S18 family serine protease